MDEGGLGGGVRGLWGGVGGEVVLVGVKGRGDGGIDEGRGLVEDYDGGGGMGGRKVGGDIMGIGGGGKVEGKRCFVGWGGMMMRKIFGDEGGGDFVDLCVFDKCFWGGKCVVVVGLGWGVLGKFGGVLGGGGGFCIGGGSWLGGWGLWSGGVC
uniref:Uncharacterized protein n=1 Tax=Knipowitschia caucasica TaxID=637954 RepID=A0AAV2LPE6_KNICA